MRPHCLRTPPQKSQPTKGPGTVLKTISAILTAIVLSLATPVIAQTAVGTGCFAQFTPVTTNTDGSAFTGTPTYNVYVQLPGQPIPIPGTTVPMLANVTPAITGTVATITGVCRNLPPPTTPQTWNVYVTALE